MHQCLCKFMAIVLPYEKIKGTFRQGKHDHKCNIHGIKGRGKGVSWQFLQCHCYVKTKE